MIRRSDTNIVEVQTCSNITIFNGNMCAKILTNHIFYDFAKRIGLDSLSFYKIA